MGQEASAQSRIATADDSLVTTADSQFEHHGVMCDACGQCPIQGTRYSLGMEDYCQNCEPMLPEETRRNLIPQGPPAAVPKPVYEPANSAYKTRFLLVIDSLQHNWKAIFAGATLPCGTPIQVEQCGWEDLSLTAYNDDGETRAMCNIRGSGMYQPDFLLLRNEVQSLPPHDYRNILMGLQFAGIPSVNSLQSVYELIERPWAYSALLRLQKKLGKEQFPLISQYYYPNFREMNFAPEYPIVAKVHPLPTARPSCT